jgi:CRISPR-associated Cas5-like protein
MTRWLVMPILAPMQSWGDTVIAGDNRPTLLFPTHSGLAGMMCAAFGIDRRDSHRLASVHDNVQFIVAEAQSGQRKRDYYTVQEAMKATLKECGKVQGSKFFLSDAAFLVAVSVGETFPYSSSDIARHLLFPKYPLCAGRRAYPLSAPPVYHRDGVPVFPEWDDHFAGLLTLLSSDEERKRLFAGREDVGKLKGPVSFYCEKSDLERYGRQVPPLPYRVRDRYHGGYRHWGYRNFDRRDVYCVRIAPEEFHVPVQN